MDVFAPWIEAWDLVPDGAAFQTPYTQSQLLPVRQRGRPCMLKLAGHEEEVRGGALMAWWNGVGAAQVLARAGSALLLERALSPHGLSSLSRTGRDEEASAILCRALSALHGPRPSPPDLPPVSLWFRQLAAAASTDPRLAQADEIARALLATPQDPVVLHGDMHHENVLDFGDRGWLAIDPKGVFGERAFDFANIFRNPDLETALVPGRMEMRLQQVSTSAGLDPHRLLRWVAAYAGLSAAWSISDGESPAWSLGILEAALARLRAG